MTKKQKKSLVYILIGLALFLAGLFCRGYVRLGFMLAAWAVTGWTVVRKALRNIARGSVFDEHFLMTVATVGAFALGEYPEGAAVMIFFQIGELFESLAVERSRRSIASLMDLRPDSGVPEAVLRTVMIAFSVYWMAKLVLIVLAALVSLARSVHHAVFISGSDAPQDMERRQLPADGDVWQALQLVDWRSILLDEKGQTAMLHRPGQRIDLGGIAKGYAADGLRKFLRQHGVRRALLDLGGTVLSLGGRLPVGIRDPFRPAGAPMGTLMLEDRLAVTSGVYERFAWLGGHRYHHIVDPRTGYPSKSGLMSVTLVGENGAALDALATAALILGPERSVPLLTEQGMDAIFVTDQGQVLITRGLKNEFRLTNKTNTMSDGQVSVA